MTSAASAETALLPTAVAVGAALASVGLTYRPLRHVVTAVHEVGHAVVALIVGRRLRSIRINRDSSGETVSVGRSRGPGVVLTLLAGYPAPSLVGLAGVWALAHEQTRTWVLALAVILGAVLLLLRNVFGVVVLLACVSGLYGLTRPAAAPYAQPAVLLASSFLLVASVRNCLELWSHDKGADDARSLATVTGVAAVLWRLTFLLASLAALGWGGWDVLAHLQAVSHR